MCRGTCGRLDKRARIDEPGSDGSVVGRPHLRVVQHAGQLIQGMLGALVTRFRHVHILFGDDVGVFFSDAGQSLVGDLFNLVLGLRLMEAFK